MGSADKLFALQDELYASRGVKLYNDLLSRQITFYTFQQNYSELEGLIRLHYQLQAKGKLCDVEGRKPLHGFLFELTRRLQNFMFAAKALADHTRNYMRLWHSDKPEIMAAYQAKVIEYFDKNGIAAFTKCLRDYFAHCTTPFISSLDEPYAHVRFTLQLETRDMEATPDFNGWSGPAKRYIAEHRDAAEHGRTQVDLGIYTNDYYEAVVRFYSWLDEENQGWCRSTWEQSLALNDQIEAFWQSVTQSRAPTKSE